MRKAKTRRVLSVVLGVLVVSIVAFLAVGLFVEGSWPNELLYGASFKASKEPAVFPADDLKPDNTIPKGAGLEGGIASTNVTFQGTWDGSCGIYGTDPNFPSGHKYTGGTFKILVEGQTAQGYCIDLNHTVRTGDTWPANIYASTEVALCPAYWILANYHHDNPGPGLTAKEEGAAIQAALWHYVNDFQPVWNAEGWCGKQAVYNRALEIMAAAQDQCIPIPTSLDVTSVPQELEAGQTADLTGLVQDQRSQPYQGQDVGFGATFGTLGAPSALTDPEGQAPNTITSDQEGTADVTVDMAGSVGAAAVDPVGVSKQRLMIVWSITYSDQDSLQIEWKPPMAVFLSYFTAEWTGGSPGLSGETANRQVLLRWETITEVDNLGFNVYRGPSAEGPWTKLNDTLIPTQVPPGSPIGATYEWLDETVDSNVENYYMLEDVDLSGITTQHGPVTP